MRSPDEIGAQIGKPRICLIGDSHLASARRAVDRGLLDLSGYEYEFWGAPGPDFRELILKRGRLRVKTDAARAVFKRVNGAGREEIAGRDFDLLVFYGARLRVSYFLGAMLHRKYGLGLSVSAAALERSARGLLISSKFYRIAATFARKTGVRVQTVSDPLLTEGIVDQRAPDRFLDNWPGAVHGTPEDREEIWSAFRRVAAADGVTFVAQPDDTVVNGAFTHPDYAVDGADESCDFGHKSPEFAARILGHLPSQAAAIAPPTPDEAKSPLLRAVG